MLARCVRAALFAGVLFFTSPFSVSAAPVVCLTVSGSSTCLGTVNVTVGQTFSLDIYGSGFDTDADSIGNYDAFFLDFLRWTHPVITLFGLNPVVPGTLSAGSFFPGDTSTPGEIAGMTDALNPALIEGSLATITFKANQVGNTEVRFEADLVDHDSDEFIEFDDDGLPGTPPVCCIENANATPRQPNPLGPIYFQESPSGLVVPASQIANAAISVAPSAAAEPMTVFLIATGATGLMVRRRARKRSQ